MRPVRRSRWLSFRERLARKVSAMAHVDADDGGKIVVIAFNRARRRTVRFVVIDIRVRSRGRTVQSQRIEIENLSPGYAVRRLRPDAAFNGTEAVDARIVRIIA